MINLFGQRVDEREKWSNQGFIVESYDEFIRMCQLDLRSQITGKKIARLTFDEYLDDCLKNLEWTEREIRNQLIMGFVTKVESEFTIQICRKSKEAIKWYFSLPLHLRKTAVYPESAPTEADMKKLVEQQAEEDVIANVKKPIDPVQFQGRKVDHTSELKIVKKDSFEGSLIKDGLKDAITEDNKKILGGT